MFYVKETNGQCAITVQITDENVFTLCPKCGREIPIDLQELFEGGDVDLCGTTILCEECWKEESGRKAAAR